MGFFIFCLVVIFIVIIFSSQDNTKSSVNNTKTQVNNMKPSVNNTKTQVNNTKTQVNNTKPSVNNTKTQVNNTKPSVNNTKTQVNNTKPSVNKIVDEQLKKIKQAQKSWGYNIYYSLKDDEIKYDINLAKEKMKRNIKTNVDIELYDRIKDMNLNDFEFIINKYDYGKRSVYENTQCSVVFAALIGDVLSNITNNIEYKKCSVQLLDMFTNDDIPFSYFVQHTQILGSCNSDEFFNSFMDYVMNILLKMNYIFKLSGRKDCL